MERGDIAFSADEAASTLAWWADAGVDVLISEEPRDWLRTPAKAQASSAPAAAPPPPPVEELPKQLGLFQAWLRESDDLPFAAPAAPRICPSGDPASGLMMMIDMPSMDDCSSGSLLSGETGALFDRMLTAIGYDRDSIYLAAFSCLRAPGGLSGAPVERCATLARHHVGLVQPRALLLFGDACAKALLGQSMAQARGRWHELATHTGPVRTLVTIPPAYLLAHPAAKKHAWADLQLLMEDIKP